MKDWAPASPRGLAAAAEARRRGRPRLPEFCSPASPRGLAAAAEARRRGRPRLPESCSPEPTQKAPREAGGFCVAPRTVDLSNLVCV